MPRFETKHKPALAAGQGTDRRRELGKHKSQRAENHARLGRRGGVIRDGARRQPDASNSGHENRLVRVLSGSRLTVG